jgi:hypothetical protein
MARTDSTESENILVKVDQNNLIFVDPNSVVNNGVVEPRGTNAENFVYYVNLEADLIPRTSLNSSNNGGGTLTSIAKGTLNLLQNKNGEYLDTSWTDLYTNQNSGRRDDNGNRLKDIDQSGQSFGMTSVQIEVKGANFIPYVNINFVDVRGKVLFDAPKQSPYGAFFHIPWPVFYLTVKGFYGKAVRYRLHLVSFNTSYNDSNGNFESNAKFVGSTYAYLNDISLTSVLNAPYMYGIEIPTKGKTNEDTGETEVKLSKSSRGYQTMLSVYQEYRRKGLITIPENVNPTLRELIAKAKRLDQLLEKEIFGENGIVDMKLFGLVKEFDDKIVDFASTVQSWGTTNVTKEYQLVDDIPFYFLNKQVGGNTKTIVGDTGGTLESILKSKSKEIKKIQQAITDLLRSKSNKNKFNNFNVNLRNPVSDVSLYYKTDLNGKIGVSMGQIFDDISEIASSFNKEKKRLQDKVEETMNTIIKSSSNGGLGFEPTIRNIFGVILAGADTYVRLMSNVHFRAYNVRDTRRDLLVGFSNESTEEGAIYPWPEVKKQSADSTKVLAYPADQDLIRKLNSDNATLWPEVEFVEEYMAVSQQITDNLAEKERTFDKTTFTFDSSASDENQIKNISTFNTLTDYFPYTDKIFASVIYEIMERARYMTLFDTFTKDTVLPELAKHEFNTLNERVKEDYFIVDVLREVTTVGKLKEYLQGFSPFERYPYYEDGIPTIPYMRDGINESFILDEYGGPDSNTLDDQYPKLSSDLLNYEVEDYRVNMYPYNSQEYLGYIGKTTLTKGDLNIKDTFVVDTSNGFISSPIKPKEWINTVYHSNMFTNVNIDGNTTSMINTPYFHKAVYEDFFQSNAKGKYAKSSYLLLNSLPFYDLDQEIKLGGNKVRMSNLFREIGSSHYIPYHLILKWGSIYHRYKKYILEGVDIMDNITTQIDGGEYFDNNLNLTFTGITRSNQTDIGLHPYYSSIYHQVVNGYLYYDVTDTTSNSFENSITNNILKIRSFKVGDFNYYNSFVDNSRYDVDDKRYTILPSHGQKIRVSSVNGQYPYSTDFGIGEQFNFNVDWVEDHKDEFQFDTVTFPSYNQKLVSTNNTISIESNTKKVIDLIATFDPYILDEFESAFLEFSTEVVDTQVDLSRYPNMTYNRFQNLLKELVTVEKVDGDDLTNLETIERAISIRQEKKQTTITSNILSGNNLMKLTITNPKELNLEKLNSYVGVSERTVNGEFNVSQLTNNTKYIELYLGEDMDGYYQEFFSVSNIELSEDNVLSHRQIIQTYAGWRQSGEQPSRTNFEEYLRTEILVPHEERLSMFLNRLLSRMSGLERVQDKNNNLGIIKSFGQDPLKLEVYNNFKLFNDRWTAGNSLGQRLIMEEFLFLDKANRDIGNDLFFDVKKLIPLGMPESQNLRLYNAISQLLSRNNLDIRPLPSYVNFYGNDTRRGKTKTSSDVASLLFGKFLDVDVEYSLPKIIIQYVGKPSSHVDASSINKDYKFKNDTFNVGGTNDNPVLITDPNYFEREDIKNSNKVVAFEVSFGDQNQGIFKSIKLDQSQFKSTFESNLAIENTARSESGSGITQVDTQLYDIYKTRSYSCSVEMMGDVMIQPTMYFQLKNVPLFEGAYWIVEVSHRIENNNITTSFTGVRMPKDGLPNPKDSFSASYRILYDKIMNSALAKIKAQTELESDKDITNGPKLKETITIPGEVKTSDSGVTEFAVPFNGYNGNQTIEKVKYKGQIWYKTRVTKINENTPNTLALPLLITNSGRLVNPSNMKYTNITPNSNYYYFLDFDKKKVQTGNIPEDLVFNCKTDFKNPLNGRTKTVDSDAQLNISVGDPYIEGPVDVNSVTISDSSGTKVITGMGMSPKLMKDLRLQEGDVVYFDIRQ